MSEDQPDKARIWVLEAWESYGIYQTDAVRVHQHPEMYGSARYGHIFYCGRGTQYAFTKEEARHAIIKKHQARLDELAKLKRVADEKFEIAMAKLEGEDE